MQIAKLWYKNQHKITFISVLLLAYLLSWIPWIKIPFTWIETFFHEFSHGIAGVLTGGRVVQLVLEWTGSGRCYVEGGWVGVVAFAGYSGASISGVLIYLIATGASPKFSHSIAAILAITVLLVMVLWVRDASSLLICLVISSIFWSAMKFAGVLPVNIFLQFIAMSVLLNASEAPLALLRGQQLGDSAVLAKVTGIAEFYWILAWLFIAILGIVFLWYRTFHPQKKRKRRRISLLARVRK